MGGKFLKKWNYVINFDICSIFLITIINDSLIYYKSSNREECVVFNCYFGVTKKTYILIFVHIYVSWKQFY